jgi:hypothetical protein
MTEQEYYDELLGKGPGDPDMCGYPGEEES